MDAERREACKRIVLCRFKIQNVALKILDPGECLNGLQKINLIVEKFVGSAGKDQLVTSFTRQSVH